VRWEERETGRSQEPAERGRLLTFMRSAGTLLARCFKVNDNHLRVSNKLPQHGHHGRLGPREAKTREGSP
jgi:hypothetical protein